jgi:hypothetical protein
MTMRARAADGTAADGVAVFPMQEGAKLQLDWGDPVQLYNHMYGSTTRLRDTAGNSCTAKKSATNTLHHRRYKDRISPPAQPIGEFTMLHQASSERHVPIHQQLLLPHYLWRIQTLLAQPAATAASALTVTSPAYGFCSYSPFKVASLTSAVCQCCRCFRLSTTIT